MERAGRILPAIPNTGLSPEEIARKVWPKAVGPKIAAHSRAVSLTGQVLVIDVDDAVWRTQLATLSPHILKRLSEMMGSGLVARLDFRVLIARRSPGRAQSHSVDAALEAADEADGITDPFLRRIYTSSRRKGSA